MKYHTIQGWLADQDFDTDMAATWAAVDAYNDYLASVRSNVSPDLQLMLDTVCIHDAPLRELVVDVPGRTLCLTLDAGDVAMRESRLVRLWYKDLVQFSVPEDPRTGFGIGFGDILIDEIEVLDGMFEHRILFKSGIEITVQFGAFRLEVVPEGPQPASRLAAT